LRKKLTVQPSKKGKPIAFSARSPRTQRIDHTFVPLTPSARLRTLTVTVVYARTHVRFALGVLRLPHIMLMMTVVAVSFHRTRHREVIARRRMRGVPRVRTSAIDWSAPAAGAAADTHPSNPASGAANVNVTAVANNCIVSPRTGHARASPSRQQLERSTRRCLGCAED
jgi:hypothetical protein